MASELSYLHQVDDFELQQSSNCWCPVFRNCLNFHALVGSNSDILMQGYNVPCMWTERKPCFAGLLHIMLRGKSVLYWQMKLLKDLLVWGGLLQNACSLFMTQEDSYIQQSLKSPVKICWVSFMLTALATYISKLIVCASGMEIPTIYQSNLY